MEYGSLIEITFKGERMKQLFKILVCLCCFSVMIPNKVMANPDISISKQQKIEDLSDFTGQTIITVYRVVDVSEDYKPRIEIRMRANFEHGKVVSIAKIIHYVLDRKSYNSEEVKGFEGKLFVNLNDEKSIFVSLVGNFFEQDSGFLNWEINLDLGPYHFQFPLTKDLPIDYEETLIIK